jgi:enoyl-[acyl-carrier protein] reductase I
MQNLFHDGGFSNMGMSMKAMDMYNKSLEDIKPEDIPQ